MKTLIVYASKYGCTAQCAQMLASRVPHATVWDVKTTPALDLAAYTTVLIGGSVYIGKMAKALRNFCNTHLPALLQKRIGIFICCALPDELPQTLTANLPQPLLSHASQTQVFGSLALLDKMGFIDKMLIKAVTKGDFSKFTLDENKIAAFTQHFASNI